MDDAIKELSQILKDSNVKIKFGLKAQGHIPVVEKMLSDGATWYEIGRVIGS